ncbi:MAG: NTP transferase domain-containing protein [Rhodothermales bacterium]
MPDLPAYRTGVVLAAGFGSRLAGTSSQTDLKPLTPVAGTPLILRTLESLRVAGCERVVIVLGHEPADVRDAVEACYRGHLDVEYVFNKDFDRQNGLSVLAARPLVDGPFLLTMADHVMGDELMEQARLHVPPPGGATLLVDYKLDAVFDMDDATKVLERDGRVEAIGKELETFNCVDTGVFVCTHGLMDALETVVRRQGDAALSDGVRLLAAEGKMHTLDIGEGFWQDVDTPEMLAHAERSLKMASHVG